MTTALAEVQPLKMHFPPVKLILDPHKMEDAYSMAVVGQIFRGLLRYSPKGDVLPDLAESWEESKDHLRYRFKLKAAKFSDGTPITAKNVQISFARMFHLGASMGADLDYIQGTKAFRTSKNLSQLGIRVISDQVVEFELSHPSALFLKHLAVVDSSILPVHDFKDELTLTAKGAYSGPYRVIDIPDAEHLVVEKWRKDALDSLRPPARVVYWTTDKVPEALALAGETDTLDHDRLTTLSVKDGLLKQGWIATPTEVTGETFLVLHPDMIPLDTRRYLYSKINPNELLKTLGQTPYRPAFGVIPSWIPGELTENEAKPIRAAAAGAVSPSGKIALDYEMGNPLEEKIADFLKNVWQTDRFKVELSGLTKSEKLKRLFGGTSPVCLGRKGLDYPDAFSVLGYFRSGYDSNYFHVNDAKIDEELGMASALLDKKQREAKYREVQISVLKQFTVIPLFFGSEASGLWSPKVKEVPAHPMGYHTLPVESIEMAKE